jgi:hypothetical protein
VLYIPDPDYERELLRTSEVVDLLKGLTTDGANLYADSVPVDQGDLKESVFGDVAMTAEGAMGRVGATDWKAALVELGTSKRSPDGSLRRSVETLGLTIEEGGR